MRAPSPTKVLFVVAVLGVLGLYELRSGSSGGGKEQLRELQKAARERDAHARERLSEVQVAAADERSRALGRRDAHLLPGDGDLRPLRIAEGGIPDGYFPIDINTHSDDPEVKLCRLDMATYNRDPSKMPMFKDLLRRSHCVGETVLTKRLSDIKAAPEVIAPTGFVFHQSRCGSTLTANILASDPQNLVYSESNPPASVALHCDHCSEEQQIDILRAVIRGMGNSRRHRRLFFKFQSANTPLISLYTKAFPDVPWIYIYRDPLEIIASHIKAGTGHRGGGAPCLRRRYDNEIKDLLRVKKEDPSVKESYCAAYLAHLNNGALASLRDTHSRGLPVRYDDIPHTLIDKVFAHHFGYTPTQHARGRMMEQAGQYSKDRGQGRTWDAMGDSEDKQKRATAEMRHAADVVLGDSYKELNDLRGTRLGALKSHAEAANADAGHDNAKARRNIDLAHHEAAVGSTALLLPPPEPPRDQYLPAGEPVVDSDGNYIPRAHREGAVRTGGVDGSGVFEETKKEYLPYPQLAPLPDLLNRWPPDEASVPDIPGIKQGSLERLDYKNFTQRARADLLRWNEVPFLMFNVPEIDATADKWASDEYLVNRFGDEMQRVTTSKNNHFMYFRKRRHGGPPNYKPPTGLASMTFKEWLDKAKEMDRTPLESDHFYLQLNSVGSKRWILDDLTVFRPEPSFFIADARHNRGANCRFGAHGIIAEAHYDGGRNFVTILRGQKRYVLLPPSECPLLYLWPKGHPEGRHAKADWSQLNLTEWPEMAKAKATEVVLEAGDVLYIPSYWFHYIISMGVTAQCNTRSGNAIRGRDILTDCGFY